MTKCMFCGDDLGSPCKGTEYVNCSRRNTVRVETVAMAQTKQDTPRSRLLDEAMKIVHHDRNANYGSPEDNFQNIANLWNAYVEANAKAKLGSRDGYIPVFTPADVAIMNMLIKVARLANNPKHHDSAVDIAGYAACLADIQESMKGMKLPQQDGSASA